MKTLEEALQIASVLLPDDEDNQLNIRNAHDTAADVMNSAAAVDYVMGMVDLCIRQWQAGLGSEDPMDCARSLAFTAFVAGVRVGREMGNTQEQEHVPQ